MIWYREAHFWSRVQIPASVFSCWEWQKTITPKGYGQYRLNEKRVFAHRFAYELSFGSIPDDLELDHLCRNRSCVNPLHLEAVSQYENGVTRSIRFAGEHRELCPKGHKLTQKNTYKSKTGFLVCKECIRQRSNMHYGDQKKLVTK